MCKYKRKTYLLTKGNKTRQAAIVVVLAFVILVVVVIQLQKKNKREGNKAKQRKKNATEVQICTVQPTILWSSVGNDNRRQQEGSQHDARDEEGASLGADSDSDSGSRLSSAARFATWKM